MEEKLEVCDICECEVPYHELSECERCGDKFCGTCCGEEDENMCSECEEYIGKEYHYDEAHYRECMEEDGEYEDEDEDESEEE